MTAPLPPLFRNGALDPDQWRPATDNLRGGYGCTSAPEVGDLVGWRYGAWRVQEIRPYLDVDLSDEQRGKLDAGIAHVSEEIRPITRARHWPSHLVLRHHNGPVIIKPGEEKGFNQLYDGTQEISFTFSPVRHGWGVLTDPYRVCSCHGHIWPCQEYDQTVLAAHQALEMDKLLETTQPGVCAHCLEVITTRQKTVTFPEESRYVPGAPGPTYHAGRGGCWGGAEKYEREGRLTDNPDIARIASCPGIRFIHEAHDLPTSERIECTAGPLCTGLHGPAGYRREVPCWHQVDLAGNGGAYARPERDCGYRMPDRGCLGGDTSSGGSGLSPIASDLLWESKRYRRW